ncbi:MAG: HU family DNA-binding protein [Desulfobacterales bacterium]|nr:HU family DNA-binding protein [Desulfobacterales bacterium]
MNKAEMVAEVAKVLDSKKAAEAAIDSILEGIAGALKKGDSISLVGFGTFKVQRQKARTGRNPKTGETLQIKAKNVAKFVPGKSLKEAVN